MMKIPGWLKRTCRYLTCRTPSPGIQEQAVGAWDAYQRDPKDHEALKHCIKCWRKILNKSTSHERNQPLEYMAKALIQQHKTNPDAVEPLREATTLAHQLHDEFPQTPSDNLYRLLVELANALFSASQCAEDDGNFLIDSIKSYRKALELDNHPSLTAPGKVEYCKAILHKHSLSAKMFPEEVTAEVVSLLDDARSTPDVPASTLSEIAEIYVRAYTLSHDTILLDKAIELLYELSTSSMSKDEKHLAEIRANRARLLLTRARCSAVDGVQAKKDLSDAITASREVIEVGVGSGKALKHAQLTMTSAIALRLQDFGGELGSGELDEMIENLTSTLAFVELSQDHETQGTLANIIRHRCRVSGEKPPGITKAVASKLVQGVLKTCQDPELRGNIFRSRFHFEGGKEDMERAIESFAEAAKDQNASSEDKKYLEDQIGELGEALRALFEPDSPTPSHGPSVPLKIRSRLLCKDVVLV